MLCLVDSSIYIFRAWQSLPTTLADSQGRAANAVFGFADILATILQHIRPDHIACAFDSGQRTGIRQKIYPAYKANRPAAPEELKIQFSLCQEVAGIFGCECVSSPAVEADDLIGSLAQLAQAAAEPVTIISGDKDLAQFITPDDTYWDFGRHGRQSHKALETRFKVRMHQMADMLALCGDKTDNIPGVPGIGPTTAARLLKKWGNIDVLFANADKVAQMRFRGAPRIAALLQEHEQTVHLARQLTGLVTDPALKLSLSACTYQAPSRETVEQNLIQLGFPATRSAALAQRVCA